LRRFEATQIEDALEDSTRTHGSNPARTSLGEEPYPGRAEIFALPLLLTLANTDYCPTEF